MDDPSRASVAPMPKILPRKSFLSLPFAQQYVIYGLMLLLCVALLPMLLDPAKLGGPGLRRAFVRPRSASQAIDRLAAFYSPGGIAQAPSQKNRLILLLVLSGLAGSVAYAGRAAHQVGTATRPQPQSFGGQVRVRARVALREPGHGT